MADDRSNLDRRQELDMVREIATHSSDIRHIQDDMDKMLEQMKAMQATLKDISATLSEAKGGWKILMMVGGASGALAALAVKLVYWYSGK
jgi:prefoldin subunit 5